MKLDFGSGYNPRPGYLKCDCTGRPGLDFYFDPNVYQIMDCQENTFDVIQCRNVVHHVQDIKKLFIELLRVLKPGGRLVIIEPSPEAYAANAFMDTLWYRGIIPRPEVWFSPEYRDYHKVLTELQVPFKMSQMKEKLVTLIKKGVIL